MRLDLHMHSRISDGAFSPAEVVRRCEAGGLNTIALSDHDDLRGIAEAQAAASQLTVLPAVEVSAKIQGRGVHILAYGIDATDSGLLALLGANRRAKRSQAQEILARLRVLGFALDVSDLEIASYPDSYIGRGHIGHALVERCGKKPGEVFKKYLAPGASAYVSVETAAAADVIDAIHGAGGFAVLAHPSHDDLNLVFSSLVEIGLDGVELFRPSRSRRLLDEVSGLAYRNDLIVTGGSDWHGWRDPRELGDFAVEGHKVPKLLARLGLNLN